MSPTKSFYLKVVRESADGAGRAREAALELQNELQSILAKNLSPTDQLKTLEALNSRAETELQ